VGQAKLAKWVNFKLALTHKAIEKRNPSLVRRKGKQLASRGASTADCCLNPKLARLMISLIHRCRQQQEAFVIAISSIKGFDMTMMLTTRSQMCRPPERDKNDQRPAIEMTSITQLTAFNTPPATFRIRSRGFHPHAVGV
jgi:hypothetical protein